MTGHQSLEYQTPKKALARLYCEGLHHIFFTFSCLWSSQVSDTTLSMTIPLYYNIDDMMHSLQLLEPKRHIGILKGTASEMFVAKINNQLLMKADTRPSTLPIRSALSLLGCVPSQCFQVVVSQMLSINVVPLHSFLVHNAFASVASSISRLHFTCQCLWVSQKEHETFPESWRLDGSWNCNKRNFNPILSSWFTTLKVEVTPWYFPPQGPTRKIGP